MKAASLAEGQTVYFTRDGAWVEGTVVEVLILTAYYPTKTQAPWVNILVGDRLLLEKPSRLFRSPRRELGTTLR